MDEVLDRVLARVREAGLPVVWVSREVMDGSARADGLTVDDVRRAGADQRDEGHPVPLVLLDQVAAGDDAGLAETSARSNFRSLLRDWPESFVVLRGRPGTLAAVAERLAADGEPTGRCPVEVLTGLAARYPVYDEDDLAALENDEVTGSWDAYVRWEFPAALPEPARDAWEALPEDRQAVMFWDAVRAAAAWPEHDSRDVLWRYDPIAEVVAARLSRAPGGPGRHPGSAWEEPAAARPAGLSW